jgi:hypothetical protein
MVLLDEWHVALTGPAELPAAEVARLVRQIGDALRTWAATVDAELPVGVHIAHVE